MRCCRKSTTWCGDPARLAVILFLVAAGRTAGAAAPDPDTYRAASAAIVESIRTRIGESRIDVIQLDLFLIDSAGGKISAVPDPGALFGTALRFSLWREPGGTTRLARVRVGEAVATVRVAVEHARTTRYVGRGEVLTASDLKTEDGEIGRAPLRRLPSARDLIGARALRDLADGELVTAGVVALPMLVRSGQTVVTRAVIGGIEARGTAVAAENGQMGDVIRVVNPTSGRRLEGRVVGPEEVEVIRDF